ncbi:MAG: Holliday junction resolvase RuvX, partial [Oscillospiraceae bacterium]
MKILSVDFGDARTGIAACDKDEMMASPLCVITEYNSTRLAEKIAEIIKTEGAKMAVVGNPLNMDGTAGERSSLAKKLAQEIAEL